MARMVRDSVLSSRNARARLPLSGKPRYRAIDAGLHLGYRKGKAAGKWVVRWYVGKRGYRVETIGLADDVIDANGAGVLNFSQAQSAAREIFVRRQREQEGLPTRTGPYTVRACLDEYLDWLENNRKSAQDARYKANAFINAEFGDLECAKLTAHKLQKWLENLAKQPARLRSKRGEAQKFRNPPTDEEARRRRRATANRVLTTLKAALNRAWSSDKIASDDAWRRVRRFGEVDAARMRYLTIDEAKRLINASSQEFRQLVQAALTTGARYGELAALDVDDFNPDSGTVRIRTSKSGRARHIVLTDEGIAYFAALSIDRSGSKSMLQKSDETRWKASHQLRPMAEACKGAGLRPPINFHCLRHTYASHAIMNGCPLMVVAKNLGHTDTRMVEKHYGHLAPSFVSDAIRAAAPQFDIKIDDKLIRLGKRARAKNSAIV